MAKRTAHDEYEYDQHLREQHTIQCEVISELRKDNSQLRGNQARLLQNLLDAEAALRLYREQTLLATRNLIQAETVSGCTPRCSRHVWDTEKGWSRRNGK